MKYIVYLLGLAWIAAGTLAILYTDAYKAYIQRLANPSNRLWLAMIPTVVGLLLLLGASSTIHGGVIAFIGVLGVVKGLMVYFNPANIFETSTHWLNRWSDQGYRLMGIVALVLGTVVISWIQ